MQRRTFTILAGMTLIGSLVGCSPSSPTTPGQGAGASKEVTEYPVKRVRFIVPWAAGSGPDAPARVIAEQLKEELGANIVVENIDGGRSLNGLYEISKAKADGSVIGWASDGQAMNPHLAADAPFKGPDMVTQIGRVKVVTNGILANPERGWKSIDDVIEAAKKAPGEITVGVPQASSSQAIQFALFAESAGVKFKTVAFGAGENVLPAVNGTVDLTVGQLSAVAQFADAGQLDWIATLGEAPKGLEVPTVMDAGYDAGGYESSEGVVAPPEMDPALAKFLSDAVKRAVESDKFQKFAESSYTTASFVDHEGYAEQMAKAYEKAPSLIEKFKLRG